MSKIIELIYHEATPDKNDVRLSKEARISYNYPDELHTNITVVGKDLFGELLDTLDHHWGINPEQVTFMMRIDDA